ncbi:MAG: M20/M25/M40 family metallo-hydrolase [Chitinophagales bacterium]|nr:M20/M25/M40 family metallo-hydrolase [Chitinophagales bacterium]MDW8428883.1 M20/M25/M40 family metallo-hydrolase [Chitinophagales bacterium]
MKHRLLILLSVLGATTLCAQENDSVVIRRIVEFALTRSSCYEILRGLTECCPHRLSGSDGADRAVNYMRDVMLQMGFDSVWLQPCYVPYWVRGEKEQCTLFYNGRQEALAVMALGNSAGTGSLGLEAPVIEVKNFRHLDSLGKKHINGKIVFYNYPFQDAFINQFQAYADAVAYRWAGASRAARYGAVAVLVRSMTSARDNHPHTGSMAYNDSFPRIPALALSTLAADRLSDVLRRHPQARLYIRNTSRMMADSVLSYNVIGELRGTVYPDRFILVGGHLDAWDAGHGAHDDGAGCVQTIEVLNTFKKLNLRPRHTLRVVLFMNEENGLRGALTYAAEARRKNEIHVFALESDAGGFVPRGFRIGGDSILIDKIFSWKKLFEPYYVHVWNRGGSGGADIAPLRGHCPVLAGFLPDSQRYFNHHHADTDTFDQVNKRELELGAGVITALVYLVDKYF